MGSLLVPVHIYIHTRSGHWHWAPRMPPHITCICTQTHTHTHRPLTFENMCPRSGHWHWAPRMLPHIATRLPCPSRQGAPGEKAKWDLSDFFRLYRFYLHIRYTLSSRARPIAAGCTWGEILKRHTYTFYYILIKSLFFKFLLYYLWIKDKF